MLFNTYSSIFLFLGLILGIFLLCLKYRWNKAAQLTLLISSLIFYAHWDYRFLILLTGSIVFNYIAGRLIQASLDKRKRTIALFSSITVNLIALCYFKFPPFFNELFDQYFHIHMANIDAIDISLPLGVSFFTFTQVAYLVEIYHNHAYQSDVVSYGLFVSIFPHLITTPVIQPRNMLEQFSKLHTAGWSQQNLAEGIFFFIMGLSKKVLIADSLVDFVHPIFDNGAIDPSFHEAWFSAIAYTVQLYFDFSGFFDMAVGLGLMFNVHISIHFNSPYQATSIIDFWRRWHHSLSTFLRDYLYMPIGGDDTTLFHKARNLALIILFGSLWHGAGWPFLVWGATNGILLLINYSWIRCNMPSLPVWLTRILTLIAMTMAWVIFRSPDLETAVGILEGMMGLNGVILPEYYAQKLAFLSDWGVTFVHTSLMNIQPLDIVWVCILCIIVGLLPNSKYWKNKFQEKVWVWAPLCSLLFVINLLSLKEVTTFLYYQF